MCPREDSNLDLNLRKVAFYPLNYGDFFIGGGGEIRTHKSLRTPVFKTGGIAVIRPLHLYLRGALDEVRTWMMENRDDFYDPSSSAKR